MSPCPPGLRPFPSLRPALLFLWRPVPSPWRPAAPLAAAARLPSRLPTRHPTRPRLSRRLRPTPPRRSRRPRPTPPRRFLRLRPALRAARPRLPRASLLLHLPRDVFDPCCWLGNPGSFCRVAGSYARHFHCHFGDSCPPEPRSHAGDFRGDLCRRDSPYAVQHLHAVPHGDSDTDHTGGLTTVTIPHSTTICPVTASETPASTPEVTGITQYTTSTLYHTSTSTDANGGVVTVTIPHSTTVCPVTATETSVAGASSSCSCTTTNTVTVDPEPVTVTVTSTSSPAGVNAADVTSPAAGVSTPVAMPSVDSAVAGVSSAPVPAASSPAAMPVVSDAAVGGAPTPVASSPVIVSTAAAESTPAAAASSPAASSAAGLVGGLTDTAGSAASDAVEAIGEAVSGTATYYTYGTDLSQGTCSFSGYTLPSSIFGTALSDSDWASAGNCGACIRVTGPQQNSIVAMIVDQCPGCGDHHLDLFQDAFTELDSLSTGRINVDWEFVPCGITSGISLLNKDGASEYWFSMQVQNSNLPVESLEVSVDGGKTWTNTTRTEYNYFEHESGFGQATVDVRITSKTGVKVEAKGVTVSSLSSHDVGDNFSS
ncbi:hypothetical protein IWX49DRAFT_319694 [Phyllosticta citricarpa]